MFFQKEKDSKNTYGIIGLGRFGSALAMELIKIDAQILVIDQDEDVVKELRNYTENAYIVKKLTRNSLSETGIQNCDVAVVCIGEKIETSVLTTLYLNSLGIPRVIAKANSMEHGEVLEKLGAEVVYPERDMAVRLARQLKQNKIVSYLELNEKIDILQLKIPEWCIGKSVQETDIRKKYGLNIMAVEHGGVFSMEVLPEYVFSEKDTIVVIGDKEKILSFEKSR